MTSFAVVLLAGSLSIAYSQGASPVTAAVIGSNNRFTLTVTNKSALAVTAFVYRHHTSPVVIGEATVSDPGWKFYDALTNQFEDQIPRHKSKDLDYPWTADAAIRIKIPIAAGLFANGSSFGDPAMVNRIVRRRKYLLAAIDGIVAQLNRQMKDGRKKNEVIAELGSTLGHLLENAADEDQRLFLRSVYGSAISKVTATLRDGVVVVLPYDAMQSQILILASQRSLLVNAMPVSK